MKKLLILGLLAGVSASLFGAGYTPLNVLRKRRNEVLNIIEKLESQLKIQRSHLKDLDAQIKTLQTTEWFAAATRGNFVPGTIEIKSTEPIHREAPVSKDSKLAQLLGEYPGLLEAKDQDGNTALILAAGKGRLETVRWLLANKADANAFNNKGETPLIRTAYIEYKHEQFYDETALVQLLLDHGGQIDARDKNGDTALMVAVDMGHMGTVTPLLAKGARVDLANNEGRTALDMARVHNQAFFELLLKYAPTDVQKKYAAATR